MSENFYSIGTPRCKTCGFPIGNATRVIYNILRNEKISNILKEAAPAAGAVASERLTNTLIDPEININTEEILDKLNIKNVCCRTCLITWKKFE